MIELIDKVIIFIFCVALYALDSGYGLNVIPVIAAVSVSCFNSYFEKRLIKNVLFAVYVLFCQLQPGFLVLLPLVSYDLFITRDRLLVLLAVVPMVSHIHDNSLILNIVTLLMLAISYLLSYRTSSLKELRAKFMVYRDTTKERAILLEKKNLELLDKQDYEIRVATLNERNRIAMEIHDNVGHMLSRCLLQLGALMAINKDEGLRGNLSSIKETLSQAMDSIRNSVHNLHDDSIDLFSQVNTLVNNFTFCQIKLEYDLSDSVDKNVKYCFITIIKEAMSNIIKHSDATEVTITLREHPALYQLIIQDNGSIKDFNPNNGIGLSNITERVSALRGISHIVVESGFKIFISIPKSSS